MTLHFFKTAAIAAVLSAMAVTAYAQTVTTVYMVRHAEKLTGSRDPSLSPAGEARTAELARVLQDADITAAFVTPTKRSRETAEGFVNASGISIGISEYHPTAAGNKTLADTIRANHQGERVLIVAHSNTVDDIAKEFGISIPELDEAQYDHLFVIHEMDDPQSAFREIYRFGAPTP